MPKFEVIGFYPVLDAELLARQGMPVVAAAEAMLEAGVRILQFRHKGFFGRAAFEDARKIAALCHPTAVFVVNDRVDIAMLLDAAAHLGQEDLAPADARKIMTPGAILGFSTHNAVQLRAGDAEPVDYLAIGPIFATGSKLNPDPVLGLDRLRELRSITKKPLVAIGGITRDTATQVFQAGADAVAVIADAYPDPCSKLSLRARTEEWLAICSSRM